MADLETIVPVILSGGAGTRLWPMSTRERPKQMLALAGDETLLQQTARRVADRERFEAPIIVASAAHAEAIEEQLEAIGAAARMLILEPVGRNSAPAIALAALAAPSPKAVLLVMPSDHVIADADAFRRAVAAALPAARDGWLVTFGIAPDSPETGYGYIRIGAPLGPGVHRVERFVEKPDRRTAETMVAEGGYAWNGGIFLFRADVMLGALVAHAPDILAAAQAAVAEASRDGARLYPDRARFAACPAESIDYAVMEKAQRVAVAPVAMGWSDVGSWDALHALGPRDPAGNALTGDVLALDSNNCLIRSDGPRVALVGVEDLIVIATGDDVLIVPRGRSQEVRRIVEALGEKEG